MLEDATKFSAQRKLPQLFLAIKKELHYTEFPCGESFMFIFSLKPCTCNFIAATNCREAYLVNRKFIMSDKGDADGSMERYTGGKRKAGTVDVCSVPLKQRPGNRAITDNDETKLSSYDEEESLSKGEVIRSGFLASDKYKNESQNVNNEDSDEIEIETCPQEDYEAGSLQYVKTCPKLHNHSQFIPVREFSSNLLPDPYKDVLFDDLVSLLATLTVRVRVNRLSADRPHKLKKKNLKAHDGTGNIIFSQWLHGEGYGIIRIATACHVVCNADEGRHTTCDLFYDEGSPSKISLNCARVDVVKIDCDESVFICTTPNKSLIEELRDAIYEYTEVHGRLVRKYSKVPRNNLVIMVSHPHSCVKYVTFGRIMARDVKKCNTFQRRFYTRYSYDMPTCPCCSGAPLFILTNKNPWTHHCHSLCKRSLGHSSQQYETYHF